VSALRLSFSALRPDPAGGHDAELTIGAPADAQILALAREDAHAALELVYGAYKVRVYTFLLRFTSDPELSDDIVQETFIRAWRHLPQLSADQRLARRVAKEIGVLATTYAATIAVHPQARRALAPLAAEHDAHVAALVALQPAPTPSASGSASPSASTSPSASPPPVAPTLAAARNELVAAELAAAERRRQQAGIAGPELARLLASIAACESVHARLVAP